MISNRTPIIGKTVFGKAFIIAAAVFGSSAILGAGLLTSKVILEFKGSIPMAG
jgi:hypothetical protein